MADKVQVAMSGLPGNMALAVAECCVKADDVELAPFGLTGPGCAKTFDVSGQAVELYEMEQRDLFLEKAKASASLIIVDYTHPTAVHGNVDFYVEHKLPFVLGTTGGDYEKIEKQVTEAKLPCVIAPNMALPIVAITAMLRMASEQYPGVFSGYQLNVKESHQKGKADTSGTAKSLINLFQKAGANFKEDQLSLCRDPEQQKTEWNIPEEHLSGHAYHTYDLHNEDQTAHFAIQHNILGRGIYAEGTVDAVRFLSKRLNEPVQRSYHMIDVLQHLKG